MLTVGIKGLAEYDFEFHIGAGKIRDTLGNQVSSTALEVQADGDELELIRRDFSNIPMTTSRVVRWEGDIAAFIVANIKL